jgi:hypothetical protein
LPPGLLAGVLMLSIRRPRHALALPRPRERTQRGDVAVVIVGLLVVPRGPHLIRNRSAEHMQDLVALVPGVAKSDRRLPHLARRVIPQLGRDDLVHRQMQARVDRTVTEIDFAKTALERLLELGMLGTDYMTANVRISEVLDGELEIAQHGRIGDELPPLDTA